jgi:hypothetical protein
MAQEARDLGLCGAEGLYRLDKFLRSLSRVLMSHGFLLHPVSVEPVPLKLFVCPAPDKRQLLVATAKGFVQGCGPDTEPVHPAPVSLTDLEGASVPTERRVHFCHLQ